MTPERWNKIKDLFSSAQECPEEERSDFLMRACGGDLELKAEVEKLLDSHSSDDKFLQDSAAIEAISIFEGDDTEGTERPAREPSPPRFEAGTILSERYEILRLLGRGGMGEVYLAKDTRINRDVALKFLHPDLVSSKDGLRRFALEARAASALNHPHIMTIYEFDDATDGSIFFVAEFVDGQTLNHAIRRSLDLDRSLDIAIQVSSALSAAHEAGITHRDIKPENIMIRRDGYVKVLDFGLAKLTQLPSRTSAGSEDPTEALHKTRPGMVMGTAAYMSPEQARGMLVDARTDVWSLGVVLYEMLTGHRPFVGDTPADITVSVLLREPPPMSSYVEGLPRELDWIVAKALSKNLDGRYQTTKELRADLERIRRQVAFDDSLSRSAGDSESRSDEYEGGEAKGRPVRTAGGVTRATRGSREDSEAPELSWSSSGLIGVWRDARRLRTVALPLAIIVPVIVVVGYFAFFAGAVEDRIDSIAVLPFENLTGSADMNYVADGISESLIDRLSQLPQLKVISRSSSFKLRGSDIDPGRAASQLGVRAIVTGSVTLMGEDVVIRVDVVDTKDDRQIAGAQYRGSTRDIEDVRNDIVRSMIERLKVKLTDGQSRRIVERSTENSEAYRNYLNGLVADNGTPEGNEKARNYFAKAIELDPEFAAAYVERAFFHYVEANIVSDPEKEMPKAKADIEKALELDGDLAKAHVVRAMVYEYEFDWRSAERAYLRAIELSPNLDFARNNYAIFLSVIDRRDEALAQLDELRIRDPLNKRMILLYRAGVLVQARQFDAAIQTYAEAQAVEPANEIPSFAVGYADGGKGSNDDAIAYYKKSIAELGGEDEYSQPLVYLAIAYARTPGKQSEARAILTKIEASKSYVSPALLAAIYCALGDNERAMALLEQAYIRRDLLLRYIHTGYEYDGLRDDPRFIDLTRRMGFGR